MWSQMGRLQQPDNGGLYAPEEKWAGKSSQGSELWDISAILEAARKNTCRESDQWEKYTGKLFNF